MGHELLKPSFCPPDPTIFHKISKYDRLSLLLESHDERHENTSRLTSSINKQSLKSSIFVENHESGHVPESETARFSLFEGAISYRHPEKVHAAAINIDSQILRKEPLVSKDLSESQNFPVFKGAVLSLVSAKEAPSNGSLLCPPRGDAKAHRQGKRRRAEIESCQSEHNHKDTELYFFDDDFAGLPDKCKNAGLDSNVLDYVRAKRDSQSLSVSMALICADRYLTSTIDAASTKACTPSKSCSGCTWYCEHAPRVIPSHMNVLAVVMVFSDEVECSYILPLSPCNGGMYILNLEFIMKLIERNRRCRS
jgi:hypothetical protein